MEKEGSVSGKREGVSGETLTSGTVEREREREAGV